MHPSMITKICAATLLAASIGPLAVTAVPVETTATPTAATAATAATTASWNVDASRVMDQISHSFAESTAMRKFRDALDEMVNGEHASLMDKLGEMVMPARNEHPKLNDILSNYAHQFKTDVTGYLSKLQTLFNAGDVNTKATQHEFTEQLLDSFHDFMDTIHKKTLKANNNNNNSNNNNSNDNSNKKKDAHLNRIVARAIEQIPQQELPDTIIPLNADTPINNESESKLVTGNDNNFAELGAIIGRMLENAVTGRAQESMDVLFLRLVKQVIITLESHNPSFEIVNKSVMDEALETVKKATDAALVTLQQQQHHHQQANSNNKPLMDATNMMFAASVGPTVQPADFKEFDTSIAPETAVLTESKTTLIPITSSLKEELIQKKQ